MDFKPIDIPVIGKPGFEINITLMVYLDLDVALSHTKKIHLLAIDQSLEVTTYAKQMNFLMVLEIFHDSQKGGVRCFLILFH